MAASTLEMYVNSGNVRVTLSLNWASLVAQTVKNLPGMQETWVQSLGWEDTLEKGVAAHSSVLAWRIPWAEEPGGLQCVGCKEPDTPERLAHITVTKLQRSDVTAEFYTVSTIIQCQRELFSGSFTISTVMSKLDFSWSWLTKTTEWSSSIHDG